jgi:glycosyltransferase involved in cell wall biosynthesis
MFSVVIPTIWSIPNYTLQLVKNLIDSDLIDDIVIIDNAKHLYMHRNEYAHPKVSRIAMDENIFVNPSWNLGVSLSKNENIIICNDDVVIEPDEMLNLLLEESENWDAVGLGKDSYEESEFDKITLTDVTERTYGWGCLMAVKKSKWINIPESIKIFYGDDFILKVYDKIKNINTPYKIDTEMSSSSSKFQSEYFKKDRLEYSTIDFSKYTQPEIKPAIEHSDSKSVSVVMSSYLGEYEGSRTNSIEKFNRAVESFVNQSYSDTELIIVSDGCELTNEQFYLKWSEYNNIKLIKTEKSKSKWPGSKRQIGIDNASGTWIAYLDTDDVLHPDHIQNIVNEIESGYSAILNRGFSQIEKIQNIGNHRIKYGKMVVMDNRRRWVYLHALFRNETSDYFVIGQNAYFYNKRQEQYTQFGTSRTFHRKDIPIKWKDRDARGEDIIFSKSIMQNLKYKIVDLDSYIVCHIPDGKYQIDL